MKKIAILFLFFYNFSHSQSLRDVFNKKITIEDGNYNLDFIENLFEKEFGL